MSDERIDCVKIEIIGNKLFIYEHQEAYYPLSLLYQSYINLYYGKTAI